MVHLKAESCVANLALGTDTQNVVSKGNPVIGLEVDVLIPFLPGHQTSLAAKPNEITSAVFPQIVSPFLTLARAGLRIGTESLQRFLLCPPVCWL